MITVTVQIGNSDDKLSQAEWSRMISLTGQTIKNQAHAIHFFGGSLATDPWQNVCWVAECQEDAAKEIKAGLSLIARSFNQDSIAMTTGITRFI